MEPDTPTVSAPRKPNPLRPSKLVLLTLPAAAMWSFPVGYSLQLQFVPSLRLLPLHDDRILWVGMVLLPAVAVCNFLGMRECVEKDDASLFKRLSLGMFNIASLFVSGGIIILFLAGVICGVFGHSP